MTIMISLAMINDLSPVFEFWGGAGVTLAVLGGLLLLVAGAIHRASMAGLGAAVWLTGALLSTALLFTETWPPVWFAVSVLPLALLGIGVLRACAAITRSAFSQIPRHDPASTVM